MPCRTRRNTRRCDMREYRFPVSERGPFVRTLGWDLLADLDLLLIDPGSPSRETSYRRPDGVISTDGDSREIVIQLYEPSDGSFGGGTPRHLSDDDRSAVQRAIDAGGPVPDVWSGSDLHNVAGRFAASVGRVLMKSAGGDEHFGTGFLYRERDLLATAAHVVDPNALTLVAIEFPMVRVGGEVVDLDRKADVAIVRLGERVPARPVAIDLPASDIKPGREALVIGYPNMPGLEIAPSLLAVRIASVRRSYLMDSDLVELSTHLGGGYSGAPVLDAGHTLVGLVVAYPEEPEGDDIATGKWPRWTPLAATSETLRTRLELPPQEGGGREQGLDPNG